MRSADMRETFIEPVPKSSKVSGKMLATTHPRLLKEFAQFA
jgi:hypothetical protein